MEHGGHMSRSKRNAALQVRTDYFLSLHVFGMSKESIFVV